MSGQELPPGAWDCRSVLPLILPHNWRVVEEKGDGRRYLRHDQLSVIISGRRPGDGRRWIHLSLARPDRLPNWTEVVAVKELFLGRERYAVQVIPPRDRYVNIHPYCLHLWSCEDGHPLPEFSIEGRL